MSFIFRSLQRLHPKHLSTGREIPSLDGIRGVAVLLVLVDHMSDAGLRIIGGVDMNRAGRFGVMLFFSLSAFLLTLPFWMRPKETLVQWRTWRDYTLRRFLRIFPLYAVVLIVTAWNAGDGFNTSDVWRHLLLLDGKRHFWTILVEVKYYLMLPVIVIGIIWTGRQRWWLGLLMLIAGWFAFKAVLPPMEKAWTPNEQLWLHRYLEVFLLGSVAGSAHAVVIRKNWNLHRAAWVFEALAWISVFTAILLLPAVSDVHLGGKRLTGGKSTEIFAVLWSVLIFCQLHGAGLLRRLLESMFLRYLGFISFSVYLWHRLILNELKGLMIAPPLKMALFLLGLLVVASASYLAIERPLSRLRLFKAAPGARSNLSGSETARNESDL